ncbi:hypothetical protein TRIUR3_31990 [Triticum urartu]|uniref:Uncharacterized protein n=1 Tax=Triticum urartu TaxID=4572 RepID=M7ZCS4_TRIUA|nr:hypothetical protein TRIUR3_31990 [Triticum urartu]
MESAGMMKMAAGEGFPPPASLEADEVTLGFVFMLRAPSDPSPRPTTTRTSSTSTSRCHATFFPNSGGHLHCVPVSVSKTE